MNDKIKKALVYTAAIVLIYGQFLSGHGDLTGETVIIKQQTLAGVKADEMIQGQPSIVYFWAEWCSVCVQMQPVISELIEKVPAVTVAVQSGNDQRVVDHLNKHALDWPVVNDVSGEISRYYQVQGVPMILVLNRSGEIVFGSSGYTTVWANQFKLAIANYWPKF